MISILFVIFIGNRMTVVGYATTHLPQVITHSPILIVLVSRSFGSRIGLYLPLSALPLQRQPNENGILLTVHDIPWHLINGVVAVIFTSLLIGTLNQASSEKLLFNSKFLAKTGAIDITAAQRRYFKTFKEPRNRFQRIDSASLCSLAGLYDNPIPTRFLGPFLFLNSMRGRYISLVLLRRGWRGRHNSSDGGR